MTLPVPDLLHEAPRLRVDAAPLDQALTFAFAAGETGDGVARVLDDCQVAESDFEPVRFVDDLFLHEFVRRCLGSRKSLVGYLERLLSQPPREQASVALRHDCFRELMGNRALEDRCEAAWRGIVGLRELLESRPMRGRVGAIQRRVEILRTAKELIDRLADDFAGCTSALRRLHEFARAVQATDAYRHLEQLLDYEDNLATVQVQLRVGHDGQLRGVELVRVRENSANPHHRSAVVRFFMWLSMLLRGYRLRGSELIGRLINAVYDEVRQPIGYLLQAGADLEFYLAALGFRDFVEPQGLGVCLPSFQPTGARGFEALFNPLLLHEPRPPVPCDVRAADTALTVVTGPNSGGKTRLLQAVGLAQLLGQAGFLVPARSASLRWREGLFVSLVHGAEADQCEGRLGAELMRIRRLFETAPLGSLVLLDELCSGTNPSEGEEMFTLVVSLLAKLEPQAFISTHFLQLAERMRAAPDTDGLAFLQVELDEQLRSTFRFVPGVAKTSLARQTAERLGVTREALLGLIEAKRSGRG